MANIGFLGCGKIGKSMVSHIHAQNRHSVSFVQDPEFKNDSPVNYPVVGQFDETLCKADLIVESATADALKQYIKPCLQQADMLIFSVTAFSDKEFADKTYALCRRYNRRIYFPHGAILGLDGIFDARNVLTSVVVETVKSPKSLGRDDTDRTIIYEGRTKDVCELYPRNVNVHAAIALAGIGFEKTVSRVISDPSVDTNSHTIRIEGDGICSRLEISSLALGGITGQYTTVSACGSLDRILGGSTMYQFV